MSCKSQDSNVSLVYNFIISVHQKHILDVVLLFFESHFAGNFSEIVLVFFLFVIFLRKGAADVVSIHVESTMLV